MTTKKYKTRVIVTACSLAFATISGVAYAQSATEPTTRATPLVAENPTGREARDAMEQLTEAAKVVRQMEAEPGMPELLQQAHGLFIIPDYGRVALGLGARGGQGVILVKQNGNWSNPAFYNFGGVSAGLQAGAEGGSLVMILNSPKAVQNFSQESNWTLNADAGLTVVNWSEKAHGTMAEGDVIMWSNAKGLLADLSLGISDINYDEDETAAFYGRQVALQEIFGPQAGQQTNVAGGAAAAGAVSAGASGLDASRSGASAQSGAEKTEPAQGTMDMQREKNVPVQSAIDPQSPQSAQGDQATRPMAATEPGQAAASGEMSSGGASAQPTAEAQPSGQGASSGQSGSEVTTRYGEAEAITPKVTVPKDAATPEVTVTPKVVIPEVVMPEGTSSGGVIVAEPDVVRPKVNIPAEAAAPTTVIQPKAVVPEVVTTPGAESSGANVTVTEPEVVRPEVPIPGHAVTPEATVTPKVVAPEVVLPEAAGGSSAGTGGQSTDEKSGSGMSK